MNSFSIALILHIMGGLGVSVALGLEWIVFSRIRRATMPEQLCAILGVVKRTSRLGFLSMLITVITGFYRVLAGVGWAPWILEVLGALVFVIVLARLLTAPVMTAIGHALAAENRPVSQTFHDLVNHPILWISIQTRVAIVLGIVFLKIATPDLGASLLTIGTAVVLGVASALPIFRPVRVPEAWTN